MKALEHPPDQREALITRAVTRIRREHEQRHGADLDTAAPASRLLNLTRAMLRLLRSPEAASTMPECYPASLPAASDSSR
jgi:hypothetical protein